MNSSLFLIVALLLSPQTKAPKNDPNGIWESNTGTKFEMKLSDSDLQIRLVEGSNPTYLNYNVDLKNTGEVNTYEGAGFFVARLKGKECRFSTTWNIVVVQSALIAGIVSHVVPDPDTCEVKERRNELVELKKVN